MSRAALFATLFVVVVAVRASPTSWLDVSEEKMRSICAGDDVFACLQLKAMSYLESFFKKDSLKLSENVEITRNSYRSNEVESRGEKDLDETIADYIQTHDATFKLPFSSSVTLDARSLDKDEVNLKLTFSDNTQPQEARKSKLKKIFIPILVFVLLKAMTLIPLALGILGLKAWNALQLSFFSFVVSVALAVFQLCKKIAADNAHPQIAAHGWDSSAAYQTHYAARSLGGKQEDGMKMAYAGYVQE